MSKQAKYKSTKTTVGALGGINRNQSWMSRSYTLFIAAFTFLLYANSIPNGYNMDDELVTLNHRLTSKGIAAIPEIFTSPYYEDQQGYAYEYRPLVLTSFAIENSLFGEKPAISHFINVLLYTLCCVLLLKVLLLVFKEWSIALSLAAALLFAAHTAHTEVVSSIKNRDEILGFLFGLLSLLAALRSTGAQRWMIVLVPILFALSLLSKTTLVPFAILIPLVLTFFTNATLGWVMLCSTLLLLPTFFLLNLGGFERFLVTGGILFAVLCFYFMVRQSFQFNNPLKSLAPLRQKINTQAWNEKVSLSRDYRTLFSGIVPPREIWNVPAILLTLFLAAIYIYFIASSFVLWAVMSLLVLLSLAYLGSFSFSWWAKSLLPFCLAFACKFTLPQEVTALYVEKLLIQYISLVIVFGNRNLFIPYLISFIFTLGLFTPNVGHVVQTALTLPITWLLVNNKARYALFALIAITFLNDLIADGFVEDWHYRIGILITIISIHFNRGVKVVTQLFLLFTIIWLHLMAYKLSQDFTPQLQGTYIESYNRIKGATDQVNPKIIKKQDRPLSYAEQSVTKLDPVSIRLGLSFEILFRYLQKTIIPYPLAFYYGYKYVQPQSITKPIPLISLVLHALLFILAVWLIRKEPLISFGILVYLLSIAFFSNYFQAIPGMMGDRFLFIPSLGWCMVLAAVLMKFSGLKSTDKFSWDKIGPVAKYTFTGALLFYSVLTFARNFDWKDDLTLFRKDIKHVDESSQAHNLLALHLMQQYTRESNPSTQQELMVEALSHFKKAQEIYPPFFNVAYDIGRVYSMMNKPDSAIIAYEYALKLDTGLPDIHLRLADLYQAKNDRDNAHRHLQQFITRVPNEYEAYSKLSYSYFQVNEYEKSLAVNRQAIRNMPQLDEPYINIGRTYLAMNQRDSARFYLFKAKAMNPGNLNTLQLIQQSGF